MGFWGFGVLGFWEGFDWDTGGNVWNGSGAGGLLSDDEVLAYLDSVSPDNPYDAIGYTFTASDLASAPTSVVDKLVSSLTSAAKSLVTKADGSLDFTKLASLAGAAYAYNRNQQSEVDLSGVGTNAGITSTYAAREQVPYQNDAYRTPGSGGRRYFTDVKYADLTDGDAVAAANQAARVQAQGLAALQGADGTVRGTLVGPTPGSSGTAGSGNTGGTPQIPNAPAAGQPAANSGPGLDPAQATGSVDDFEQWKLNLTKGVSPATFNKDYKVPDWMRAAGLMLSDPGSSVAANEFFKANPQYAADYQRIMQGGVSEFATDGSTLGKTDISAAPDSVRSALADPNTLLGYEGSRLDPVLGEAVRQGLVGVPEQYKGNVTQYLRTHKWTPNGVVANDNATTMGGQQMYGETSGAYKLGKWDAGTGDLITPDGRRISNADYMNGIGSLQPFKPVATAADTGSASAPYTPPAVGASNSAADVARMYQAYTAANGGDTVANRNAAIDYLQQNGVSTDTIGQAYQQYLGSAATPAAVGNSLFAPPANGIANNNWYAEGGQVGEPRYLDGGTNGQSDEIPATIEGSEQAALSHGEFVVPADVVAALGGGNSNSGAEVLYDMMDRIRQQAYGHKQQMRPVDLNKTLPA